MFGYIKPAPPELKVKEYELYKAVYCGLCRSMGKNTACMSRFALSYDFVFLALVRIALSEDTVSISSDRCIVHPFRKRAYVVDNASLKYCSASSAILNYHKVKDDISDSRLLNKLPYIFVLPAFGHMRSKAGSSELDRFVASKLKELSELEREDCQSADRTADVFGELLGKVFSHGLDSDASLIAYEIGKHTGRWIYLLDAACDYEHDIKSGSYNPFKVCGGPDTECLRTALNMELVEIERAVNLIRFNDEGIENIIKNIIYMGMPQRSI